MSGLLRSARNDERCKDMACRVPTTHNDVLQNNLANPENLMKIKVQTKNLKSKILIIVLFSLLCTACQNGIIRKETPKDLLEQTVFESVLWEFYMIEGDVRSRLRNDHLDTLRTRITAEVNAMYEKYNIDHEQFLKNYAYYMKCPNLSTEMMKNIVNLLVELQAQEETKGGGEQ